MYAWTALWSRAQTKWHRSRNRDERISCTASDISSYGTFHLFYSWWTVYPITVVCVSWDATNANANTALVLLIIREWVLAHSTRDLNDAHSFAFAATFVMLSCNNWVYTVSVRNILDWRTWEVMYISILLTLHTWLSFIQSIVLLVEFLLVFSTTKSGTSN